MFLAIGWGAGSTPRPLAAMPAVGDRFVSCVFWVSVWIDVCVADNRITLCIAAAFGAFPPP